MTIGFTNKAVGHLAAAIGTADTRLTINTMEYAPIFESAGDYLYLMLRGPINREIVKVDLANSSWGNYLTIVRAQGGTAAVAWPLGSMLFATTHEDHYNAIIQRGANRIVTANPNEVETPQFAGEKIYQSGPAGYERWWKSFNDSNLYWDLITGAIGANEEYTDVGWDFPILKPTTLPFNYTWALAQNIQDLTSDTTQKTPWRSIIYDPVHDTLTLGTWASGTGGWSRILNSYDGGKNWKARKHFLNESSWLYSFAFDPVRNTIFAAVGNTKAKIWASNDGGNTWTEKYEFTSFSAISVLVYNPKNAKLIAGVASPYKIFTSGDGGDTWAEKEDLDPLVFAYDGIYDVEHDVVVFASSQGQIHASDDGGETWELKKDFTTDPQYPNTRCDGLGYDPDLGYLYVGVANDGLIWRSKDGAETWEMVQNVRDLHGGYTFYIPTFTYDPIRKIMVAGEYGVGLILMSRDGGNNWEISINLHDVGPTVYAAWASSRDPGRDRIIIGTYNDCQIWTGDDPANLVAREYTFSQNKNFTDDDPDLELAIGYVYDVPTARIVLGVGTEFTGGGHDCYIYISTDHGDTWTLKKTFTGLEQVTFLLYDSFRDQIVAGFRYGEVHISDDGGDTWALSKDIGSDATYPTRLEVGCYDYINDVLIVSGQGTGGAGSGTKIWKSDNGGSTWSMVKDLAGETPKQSGAVGIVHDPRHDVLVIATTTAEIWASSDAGVTWARKKSIKDDATYPSTALRSMGVDPRNGYCYAGAYGNADIWRSTDAGETWEMVYRPKSEYPFSFYLESFGYDPSARMMFAGEWFEGIVFGSRDGGDTWTVIRRDYGKKVGAIFSNPGNRGLFVSEYDGTNAKIYRGYEDSAWHSVFDDTKWKTYDGTSTWGIWRLGKWESVTYAGGTQNLLNITPLATSTWHLGYRPSKLRVGFDGGFPVGATVYFGVRFQPASGPPFQDRLLFPTSDLEEIDIPESWYEDADLFDGSGNIIKFFVAIYAPSPSFKLTSIEFYGTTPF